MMLSKKELLSKLDKKYEPMINQISIADFTKCVAQFSGLTMDKVSTDAIFNYLTHWAENKYKYFQMLGNSVRKDIPIEYNKENDDKNIEFETLEKEYPSYAPWLDGFKNLSTNKIDSYRMDYDIRDMARKLFPTLGNLDGTTLTHFFKKYLNAPDELVTAIGRIFENDKVTGTYTISIDPVDMMLASENPYDWRSCYKLATDCDSHADGCLAAIIDTSSLITYIWSSEGKFNLYDNYTFKNVRYKKMREWISISPKFNAIHFNAIYPGKNGYSDEFEKQLREIVEGIVAEYTNVENKWRINVNYSGNCERVFRYGYGEFSPSRIYTLSNNPVVDEWTVYDVEITCPCGCKEGLPGADWDEDEDETYYEYEGGGFVCYRHEEHYREPEYWCEYADDYCSHECCREYCEGEGCSAWDDNHPICSLDEDEEHECEDPQWEEVDNGFVEANEDHCCGCPFYKLHHPEATEEDEEKITNDDAVDTIKTVLNLDDDNINAWIFPTL